MEDGLSIMDIFQKMAKWWQKNVLLTKQKQKVLIVENIKIVQLQLEFMRATLLEGLMVNLVRKKWWKKYLETVLLMENLMCQECSLIIKRVFFQTIMKPRCQVI